MKLFILFFVFIFFFASCTDGDIEKRFLGNYYLIATDVRENMALSYKKDSTSNYGFIVEPTVFGIGYNKKFIIVMQHPQDNKKIINYFIIPVNKEFKWTDKNNLMSPLTLNEFNLKRKALGIENLKFSIVYDDLK